MTRFALLLVLGAAGIGCGLESAFACETREDCNDGRRGGFCEIEGYCSFTDEECGSGRRYGEHAPQDIAGVCTPAPDNEPNFLTGSDESSTSTPELDSATAAGDAGESDEGTSEGPRDTDAHDVVESSDDGSSSDVDGGEVGEDNGGDEGGTEEGAGSSSSGADEDPEDCNALDCASCLDCVARPSGPCDPEVSACAAADGCTAGVACNRSCLLTGVCFEDCCYGGVESEIDDVVMCGADHCIDACSRFEFLTCA